MKKLFLLNLLALLILISPIQAQWTDPVLVDAIDDTLGINWPSWDWCPYIMMDEQLLYFASARDDYVMDIYVSRRSGDAWTEALRLPFCLNGVNERNPAVNATNDTLYFVRWAGSWDIFWSFRTGPCDTCWGEPSRMPEPINSSGIEFSVWCTPDNQRLLFSSWRISANGEDIYECRRDHTTPTGWSEPAILPGHLNTWDMESYPSMGLDTTELFFWGRSDQICVSSLTDSGWTVGTALPSNINRVIIQWPSESTPCITPDGRRLYFYSRWSDSGAVAGDIWYSDRINSIPNVPRYQRGELPELRIIPQPVRDSFTIVAGSAISGIQLYDILGREVLSKNMEGGIPAYQWSFNSPESSLPSGPYFLVGRGRDQILTGHMIILR